MKRMVTAGLALALLVTLAAAGQAPERWLHVRVEKTGEHAESVRINVPLSLAEKLLPAVNADRLRNGRIVLEGTKAGGVDLRAVFEAVKSSSDGEFVTVESDSEQVRVAKSGGYLIVRVREERARPQRADQDAKPVRGKAKEEVDVRVPLSVVEALLSAGKDELDVLAAIRALAAHGDTELVSVRDGKETVRIWIDTKNAQ